MPSIPKPKLLLMTHLEAAAMVGVPSNKLLRWAKGRKGNFPSPIRIVERTYLFNRQEVEQWCSVRPISDGANHERGRASSGDA